MKFRSLLLVAFLTALFTPAVWATDEPDDPNVAMLNALQVEKRRQLQWASQLQEDILAKTRKAAQRGGVSGQEGMIASLVQGESLLQHVAVAEVQLVALRASKKAAEERHAKSQDVPVAVLLQLNPEFAALNSQKAALQQKKEALYQNVSDKNDPRILEIERQIVVVEEKLGKMFTPDENWRAKIVSSLQTQVEVEVWQIGQDIRMQEILIEELQKKYAEHLAASAKRAEATVDISFEQTQLAKVNKTIDQIEDRIFAISMQARGVADFNVPNDLGNQTPLLRIVEILERIEARLAALEGKL